MRIQRCHEWISFSNAVRAVLYCSCHLFCGSLSIYDCFCVYFSLANGSSCYRSVTFSQSSLLPNSIAKKSLRSGLSSLG